MKGYTGINLRDKGDKPEDKEGIQRDTPG